MRNATKISDKLTKVNECVNVYYYDNGYMVEVSGSDSEDDWTTIKLMCKNLDEVQALLQEADTLPRS